MVVSLTKSVISPVENFEHLTPKFYDQLNSSLCIVIYKTECCQEVIQYI